MIDLTLFAVGGMGSLVCELARALYLLEEKGELPPRYRRPVFWALRMALAVCAGAFVLVLKVDSGALAGAVGFSTPSLLLILGGLVVKLQGQPSR